MKKITKLLVLLVGIFPLILNAETNEEMKWRWYTYLENNIHYENDVEHSCEYLEIKDKNTFIYGDWIYTLTKPEEKEYRIVEEINETLNIDRSFINMINIRNIVNDSRTFKLYDLIVLDENNNQVQIEISSSNINSEDLKKIIDNDISTFSTIYPNYNIFIKFPSPIDIKKLTIKLTYDKDESFLGLLFDSLLNEEVLLNSFEHYSTDNENICEDNICSMKIKVKAKDMNNEPMYIKTKTFKYRDKYYKCYTQEKFYVPGFFKELEGFTKDEDNYEITKTESTTISNNNDNNYLNEVFKSPVNSKLTDKLEETDRSEDINENKISNIKNNQIAIVTKKESDTNKKLTTVYKILLLLLIIFSVLVTIARKVKKSRTN